MKKQRSEFFESKMGQVANIYNHFWLGSNLPDELGYMAGVCVPRCAVPRWMHYTIESYGHNLGEYSRLALDRLDELRPRDDFWTSRVPNLAGSPRPSIVLVGDKVNPEKSHTGWPFYAYSGSSEYLAAACHMAGLNEDRCAWFNVNHEIGRAHV